MSSEVGELHRRAQQTGLHPAIKDATPSRRGCARMKSRETRRALARSVATSSNGRVNLDRRSTSSSEEDDFIKQYYERWWENPQDIRGLIFERLNELVRQRIGEGQPALTLDLGSGKGRVVSMLVDNGSNVTAVEFNSNFVAQLRAEFPDARVISADIRDWNPDQRYDLVTCIELTQVLTHEQLAQLLTRLRPYTHRILINVSNRRSLHGIWVRIRRFQAPFIVTYTSGQLVSILRKAGFRVTWSAGAGFLTPLSLLREFRAPIVSKRLSARFEKLDKSFPRLCHLFLVEADSGLGGVG